MSLLSQKTFWRTYANKFILSSFLFLIIIGAFLLRAPYFCSVKLSWLEAIFMSTSATCATGLSIIDWNSFTTAGYWLLIVLMQIGSFGLLTISFLLSIIFFQELGVGSTFAAKHFFSLRYSGKLKDSLKLIFKVTLFTQFVGALIMFARLYGSLGYHQALFSSIFYSVSAFSNSGISLAGENSITLLKEDPLFMAVITILSFLGGLGSFVLYELFIFIKSFIKYALFKKPFKYVRAFSLHADMVLTNTLWICLVGSCFFFFVEKDLLFKNLSYEWAFAKAALYNLFLRSAGFWTFDITKLSNASKVASMAIMIIGTAPGSTGGGIKLTTFGIFISTLISIFKGRNFVEFSGRTIAPNQVYRAVSILALVLSWLFVSTIILLISDPGFEVLDVFFENSAALSNTGLSMGITSQFSSFGKAILILNMIAGRIGILTFILAIRTSFSRQLYKFPEEEVILG